MALLILNYGLAIALCFHVVRTGQATFWLWIVLAFPGIGPLAYVAVVLVPGMLGGSTARRLGAEAKRTLDPMRGYREAKAACEDSPTVGNRMRLAQAAMARGSFSSRPRSSSSIDEESPERRTVTRDISRSRSALPQRSHFGSATAEMERKKRETRAPQALQSYS